MSRAQYPIGEHIEDVVSFEDLAEDSTNRFIQEIASNNYFMPSCMDRDSGDHIELLSEVDDSELEQFKYGEITFGEYGHITSHTAPIIFAEEIKIELQKYTETHHDRTKDDIENQRVRLAYIFSHFADQADQIATGKHFFNYQVSYEQAAIIFGEQIDTELSRIKSLLPTNMENKDAFLEAERRRLTHHYASQSDLIWEAAYNDFGRNMLEFAGANRKIAKQKYNEQINSAVEKAEEAAVDLSDPSNRTNFERRIAFMHARDDFFAEHPMAKLQFACNYSQNFVSFFSDLIRGGAGQEPYLMYSPPQFSHTIAKFDFVGTSLQCTTEYNHGDARPIEANSGVESTSARAENYPVSDYIGVSDGEPPTVVTWELQSEGFRCQSLSPARSQIAEFVHEPTPAKNVLRLSILSCFDFFNLKITRGSNSHNQITAPLRFLVSIVGKEIAEHALNADPELSDTELHECLRDLEVLRSYRANNKPNSDVLRAVIEVLKKSEAHVDNNHATSLLEQLKHSITQHIEESSLKTLLIELHEHIENQLTIAPADQLRPLLTALIISIEYSRNPSIENAERFAEIQSFSEMHLHDLPVQIPTTHDMYHYHMQRLKQETEKEISSAGRLGHNRPLKKACNDAAELYQTVKDSKDELFANENNKTQIDDTIKLLHDTTMALRHTRQASDAVHGHQKDPLAASAALSEADKHRHQIRNYAIKYKEVKRGKRKTIAGVAGIVAGTLGVATGVLLTLTGVGAVGGVPLKVASALLIKSSAAAIFGEAAGFAAVGLAAGIGGGALIKNAGKRDKNLITRRCGLFEKRANKAEIKLERKSRSLAPS